MISTPLVYLFLPPSNPLPSQPGCRLLPLIPQNQSTTHIEFLIRFMETSIASVKSTNHYDLPVLMVKFIIHFKTKPIIMSFSQKLSNGWKISLYSFSVLRENKNLIIFPILSTVSMILIFGSVITAVLAANDWDPANFDVHNRALGYFFLFLFYLVNYFIVVFFNMALIECTRLYFHGQKPTVADG